MTYIIITVSEPAPRPVAEVNMDSLAPRCFHRKMGHRGEASHEFFFLFCFVLFCFVVVVVVGLLPG